MRQWLPYVRFPDKALDEFCAIVLKNSGISITRDQANDEANNLYRLFDAISEGLESKRGREDEPLIEPELSENEEKALAFIQEQKRNTGKYQLFEQSLGILDARHRGRGTGSN